MGETTWFSPRPVRVPFVTLLWIVHLCRPRRVDYWCKKLVWLDIGTYIKNWILLYKMDSRLMILEVKLFIIVHYLKQNPISDIAIDCSIKLIFCMDIYSASPTIWTLDYWINARWNRIYTPKTGDQHKGEPSELPVIIRMDDSGNLNRLISKNFMHLASLIHPFSSWREYRYEIPQITALLRPCTDGGWPEGAWLYGDGG